MRAGYSPGWEDSFSTIRYGYFTKLFFEETSSWKRVLLQRRSDLVKEYMAGMKIKKAGDLKYLKIAGFELLYFVLFVIFFDEFLYGHGHRRALLGGSLDIEAKPCFFDRFCCGRTESCDYRGVLNKIREILKQ